MSNHQQREKGRPPPERASLPRAVLLGGRERASLLTGGLSPCEYSAKVSIKFQIRAGLNNNFLWWRFSLLGRFSSLLGSFFFLLGSENQLFISLLGSQIILLGSALCYCFLAISASMT